MWHTMVRTPGLLQVDRRASGAPAFRWNGGTSTHGPVFLRRRPPATGGITPRG